MATGTSTDYDYQVGMAIWSLTKENLEVCMRSHIMTLVYHVCVHTHAATCPSVAAYDWQHTTCLSCVLYTLHQ